MKLPIGLMQTAGSDPEETLLPAVELGVKDVQVGVPGHIPLNNSAAWNEALAKSGIRLHTVFGVYTGESYADIPTVRKTVGFVPRETREERLARTMELLHFAADIGAPGFATHLGFITGDQSMVELVRRIADEAAKLNMTFALETGQESADELLDFLLLVNRDNVGVNFDPANMVLYGAGDPVRALETLQQHLITVHAKDGTWPSAAAPGSLGVEVPLGKGVVDFRGVLKVLERAGYKKPLFIEREVEDHAMRTADIASGKQFLEGVMSGAATA